MITFKLLTETARCPKRGTAGSAGFDLYADESFTLWPDEQRLVSTGVSCAIGGGLCGLIWPRSGLALKYNIDTRAGVIDEDYRGEIKVLLRNEGTKPFEVQSGMRVAQLIVQPYMIDYTITDELPPTARGSGGFGSTGE